MNYKRLSISSHDDPWKEIIDSITEDIHAFCLLNTVKNRLQAEIPIMFECCLLDEIQKDGCARQVRALFSDFAINKIIQASLHQMKDSRFWNALSPDQQDGYRTIKQIFLRAKEQTFKPVTLSRTQAHLARMLRRASKLINEIPANWEGTEDRLRVVHLKEQLTEPQCALLRHCLQTVRDYKATPWLKRLFMKMPIEVKCWKTVEAEQLWARETLELLLLEATAF